jgi:diguanylate cyclase (GGDEF)-like protein/PAS domain S-box-containing protein
MERKTTEENEFTRKIFEATPIGLTMFNKNLNIIDCNDASIEMYGATKQYFIDRFPDFSPEYQPDGRKSMEKASELMKRTLNGETLTLEWMHNKLNGEPIPCEIKLTPAIYNGELIGLGYVYDLSNIKNLEKDIEHLVTKVDKIYYDWLTGIYNRRYFDENLNRIVKFLSRSNGIITLMMIDIDFFKDYNDTYGHREGDKCLKTVAAILEDTTMRDDDIVARYGGEEFIVVLPNTDENGARFIADNMLRNIRKHNIPHSKNDAAECVTISIGIATGKVTSMSSGENFVKSADEMLYKSKRDGRNRYNFVNV